MRRSCLCRRLVERAEALVDRHPRTRPVQVVHVEVVDAQPAQRRVTLVDDVSTRAAAGVRVVVSHWRVHLAGEHQPVAQAGALGQQPAQQLLACPSTVYIGRIDAVDSMLHGDVEHLPRIVGARRTSKEHRAEAERADRHPVRPRTRYCTMFS
jgi:hypothetical protein